MFSRFQEEAQKVLIIAKKEMMDLKHPYVGSEHLLLAILKTHNEVRERLNDLDVTYDSFKAELIKFVGYGKEENKWFLYTPLLKRILENASLTSREVNASEVQLSHLFLAMLEEGDGIALRILEGLDVDIDDLYEEFSTKIVDKKSKQKRKLLIEEFGVDLTKRASQKEIDPVIGRDDELQRMIEILSRRNKNNPLLVGEAGVGKTAVVEELARRIVNNDVPATLKNKRIISVEIASLVAGTKYRGEFEERVSKILREVESRDDVIVFIDEVHTLIGAGGAEGAIDASNILKPALARGKLRLIGATTLDEYKKTIEKDKAFDRRFQKLEIIEPTLEKTYDILLQLKDLYCSFHGVSMDNDLLKDIIRLTDQYMYQHKQPDKSIDILDEVCSKVRLRIYPVSDKFFHLKQSLSSVQEEKNKCIRDQNFVKALSLREEEKRLHDQINRLELKSIRTLQAPKVSIEDIRQVIFEKTKIPIFDINSTSLQELKNMELVLSKKIIGQKEAIQKLCEVTKRIQLGLVSSKRPASFLFVGPTGVGKTYLVKEYTKFLRGEDHLIRLDMSEYRESHSISKIIGSPSGYVGYDDGKNVLEDVRNCPYSVLLLDEIEKAHPAVLNLFLQILDEGFIKDAVGRKIRFDNTIIIMTSNIGFGKEDIGFTKETSSINTKLKEFLSIEFINRIDQVLVFKKLEREDMEKILKMQLDAVRRKFSEKGVRLQIRSSVIEEMLDASEYLEFGARKLDKLVMQKLDALVIDEMLLGKKCVTVSHLKV